MELGYKTYEVRDFIRKTEAGELDIKASVEIVKELAATAGFHTDHNILLDLRDTAIAGPVNLTGLLEIVMEFVRYEYAFKNKIAVLIPNKPERIMQAQYIANAMQVKGLSCNYFTDFEAALDWMSTVRAYPDNST